MLVIDVGYVGYVEVVWEFFVDIIGEKVEFFLGDFCVVGGVLYILLMFVVRI